MMTFKTFVGSAMVLLFLLSLGAIAQDGGAGADRKDRVLDLLFPSDVATSPFLAKMTLRFGDSDTQFVVITYPVYPVHPGGRAELISYSIGGLGNKNLSQFISEIVAQNSNVTDQEIAGKVKVNISRSPIKYDALDHSLSELRAIQLSPVLESRVAVDDYSEYKFWYDSGQESVHYSVTGPFKDAPQDKLVQWMIRFRVNLPNLLKAVSAPKR